MRSRSAFEAGSKTEASSGLVIVCVPHLASMLRVATVKMCLSMVLSRAGWGLGGGVPGRTLKLYGLVAGGI